MGMGLPVFAGMSLRGREKKSIFGQVRIEKVANLTPRRRYQPHGADIRNENHHAKPSL